MISCGARLAVFDIAELREVTAYDELELDTLGDRKTALFLIMSDTDDSFNFLISMCYTQLFNLLCEKADDVYGGRLPVHVRCLIDECANIGQIPKLEKLVATIRSREISACLVLQAQSQLKAIYKDNADTIIGNMDTSIFLGGKEPTTLKELAAVLGKETIDTYNTGESRGRETSHSLNYQKLGKELMSQDELSVMDGGKCILQLRGVRPFLSDKYDITKHPNYPYTADADPKIFAVQSLMIRHFDRELADDAGDYVTWMGFACKTGDGRRASRYTRQKRIFSACGGAALYRKSILEEIGTFDENFFASFEDVDLSWRANNAGYKCVLCPTAKCYHICGASTGAVKYNAFKSQQSGRNSILLPLKNEPLLMLILNFIPLAVGYLLKCYKFHKQGFGEAWDKGMHEAFALLKSGRLGKRPFRLKDLPNYILMELWMIWNMVPYLWYRLVIVKFDLK